MTPEQEEQVRHLLATAAGRAEEHGQDVGDDGPGTGAHRVDPPVPAHVAARLDAVLADLVSERAAGHHDGELPARVDAGDELAARVDDGDELAARRARRWPQVLVAAAVVSVLALGGGLAVLRGSSGNDAGSADSAGSQAEAGGGTGQREAAPGSAAPQQDGSQALPPVVRLRSATLRADVQRFLDGGAATLLEEAPNDAARGSAGCASPRVPGNADVVDVLLDGHPATLALVPTTDGAREARVYSCAEPPRVLARTRVDPR